MRVIRPRDGEERQPRGEGGGCSKHHHTHISTTVNSHYEREMGDCLAQDDMSKIVPLQTDVQCVKNRTLYALWLKVIIFDKVRIKYDNLL